MANTRPLRYGGVMNSGFPTPPPGVFDDEQLGKPVLFGMTTSLILQSVPLPKDCDLNATELHTVSDSHRTRIRAVVPPTTPHIWKPLSAAHNARINKHVHALNLVHTWAQLAAHMSLESLVILGDATLTAIARKPPIGRPHRRRNLSGLCAAGQRTSEIQRESHMHDRT